MANKYGPARRCTRCVGLAQTWRRGAWPEEGKEDFPRWKGGKRGERRNCTTFQYIGTLVAATSGTSGHRKRILTNSTPELSRVLFDRTALCELIRIVERRSTVVRKPCSGHGNPLGICIMPALQLQKPFIGF